MARNVTLAALRSRVRQRADIETALHITDTEVNDSINESIAALHSMIVEAGEDDFLTWGSFSTFPDIEFYSLAGAYARRLPEEAPLPPFEENDGNLLWDFYKLEWVEVRIDGKWFPVDRWSFDQRHLYENSTGSWSSPSAPKAYRITKQDLMSLLPIPTVEVAVRVWVHQASAKLGSDSAKYDGRDGWEEWVVLDAAIKCGVKEESDVSALMRDRDRIEARIKGQARSKDRAHPRRVRDVDAAARRDRNGWDG